MIETDNATPKPTVDGVVTAARHRMLLLLARVSKRQGTSYDGPSLVIARELYPSLVTVRTWTETYGGYDWGGTGALQSLAYYTQRGYVSEVSATVLRDEYQRVSRETVTPPVPAPPLTLDEPTVGACNCDNCEEALCGGSADDDHEQCDDHGCEECYGTDYRCDDHGCDACRPDCYTASCCGYCTECASHPDGPDDSDTCSNCGYCHECGHVCGDVD